MDGPGLSVSPRGDVYLNAEAYAALGKPARVVLNLNRRRQQIEIWPAAVGGTGRAYIVGWRSSVGWGFSPKLFLRDCGLLGRYRRWERLRIVDGMLVLPLGTGSEGQP